MDYSSESCVNPEEVFQLSKDTTDHLSQIHDYTPELCFLSQHAPMEFIDGSLEYQKTTSGTHPYLGLIDSSYGAGSDLPSSLALPIDLQYQRAGSTLQDRTKAIHKPQLCGNNKFTTLQQGDEKATMTQSRRSSRSSNKLTSDESGGDKRERNRMAAYKCRKKQKMANSELQEKSRIMDEQHSFLMANKAALETEILGLKNELLLHGSCGCEPISDYLMQAARKFVRGREEQDHGVEKKETPRERPPSVGHELFPA
ncbi:hypothetical protein M426DRAFT_326325 [Hypoxylon sp. CI-4A]|nr:hypothetical protein M426DRAFT_326325 [Hypoxylon sp. CI-4A]